MVRFKLMQNKSSRIYDQQGLSTSKTFLRENTKKQNKKIFRILLLIFFSLILLTLIAQIPSIINKLRKPFISIQGTFANLGEVNLKHRTNILLVNLNKVEIKELGFVSLEGGDHKIKLIKLNPKLKVLENNELVRVQDLLITKENYLNIDGFEASLVRSLGYVFDGYIVMTNSTNFIQPKPMEKLVDYFYSLGFFIKIKTNKEFLDTNLRTNLTLDQITNLSWFGKNLVPDRIDFIDLTKSIDGSGLIDNQLVTNRIGLLLTDTAISVEESTIEIENSSNVSGVGTVLKNIISNLGGSVLVVTKGEQTTNKTQLLVRSRSSKLGQRLETILGVKMQEIKKEKINSDIKVIIGDDYGKYFDF